MQDWLCNWQWKKKKKFSSGPFQFPTYTCLPWRCLFYPEWYVYSLLNMRKGVTNIFCLRFPNFFPFFFFIIVEIFTDKDLVHSRIGSPTILMVLMNQIHCLISVLTYSLLPIIHIFNNLPRSLTMLARQKKRASVLECSLHLITQKITL